MSVPGRSVAIANPLSGSVDRCTTHAATSRTEASIAARGVPRFGNEKGATVSKGVSKRSQDSSESATSAATVPTGLMSASCSAGRWSAWRYLAPWTQAKRFCPSLRVVLGEVASRIPSWAGRSRKTPRKCSKAWLASLLEGHRAVPWPVSPLYAGLVHSRPGAWAHARTPAGGRQAGSAARSALPGAHKPTGLREIRDSSILIKSRGKVDHRWRATSSYAQCPFGVSPARSCHGTGRPK